VDGGRGTRFIGWRGELIFIFMSTRAIGLTTCFVYRLEEVCRPRRGIRTRDGTARARRPTSSTTSNASSARTYTPWTKPRW
jgi:hypothetical protein